MVYTDDPWQCESQPLKSEESSGRMEDKVNIINFTFTISGSFRGKDHKTYCCITIATFRILSKVLNCIYHYD